MQTLHNSMSNAPFIQMRISHERTPRARTAGAARPQTNLHPLERLGESGNRE